jgi:Lipase
VPIKVACELTVKLCFSSQFSLLFVSSFRVEMKFLIIFVLCFAGSFCCDEESFDGTFDEPITRQFEARRDMRFLVFTRFNPTIGQQVELNDIASVHNSNYNSKRQTRFIIHGFQSNASSEVNTVITAAYLRNDDFNVIVADWGVGANTVRDWW